MSTAQYAVQKAESDVLARYGLDKVAGAQGLLDRAASGAKWLVSRHPNTRTYTGKATGWDGFWNKATPKGMYVTKPGYGPGLVGGLKDVGHFVGETARDWYLGDSGSVYDKLKERYKATGSVGKAIGGHYKDYYWDPQGGFMKPLSLGLTALDLYSAVSGDKSQRMGDLAAAATGAAIAPITGHMGAVAGMPLHAAVTGVARRLGHKLDAAPVTPEAPAMPQGNDVHGHTRRWLRTGPGLPDLGVDASQFTPADLGG